MTLDQVMDAIVSNTVAVLTTQPAGREAWWQSLGDLERQAREAQAEAFAAFARCLRNLVLGDKPAAVAPDIPAEFRPVWERIVAGIAATAAPTQPTN